MKNKKKYRKKVNQHDSVMNLASVFVVTVMLCSIITGCFAAVYLSDDSRKALSEIIVNLKAIANVQNFAKNIFMNFFKYPIILFALGFTAFGFFIIPMFVFVRTFSVSFTVATVVFVLGYKGVTTSFLIYGIQSLASVACILILSSKGMRISYGIAKSLINTNYKCNEMKALKSYFIAFVICIVLLLICAFSQVLCTRYMVSLI